MCSTEASGARPTKVAAWVLRGALLLLAPCRAERVAICVTGRLRALERTLETFEKNVLGVFQAESGSAVDVFVYSPSPNAGGAARLSTLFQAPTAVRGVRFDDEVGVLESLGRTKGAVLKQAMRIKGNWLGSARQELLPGSRDRRSGTGLFQMYGHNHCLEMIQDRELRLGVLYDRVVTTRTDLRWIYPHPPLSRLSPNFAWAPDTNEDDWGGVYDRHIVMPRAVAALVLNGWHLLTSGRAFSMILSVAGERALRGNTTNTEVWLAIRLALAGARVGRFPMTAYIACDMTEWGESSTASPAGSIHGTVHGFACQHGRDFRYPKEHAAVTSTVECMSEKGGWSVEGVRRCYCQWYSSESLREDSFALCHR